MTVATDGSYNVTIVDGTDTSGIYAEDGSFNVFQADGSTFGSYHPCGAWVVTLTEDPTDGARAPDGSFYVSVSPYVLGTQAITVVAGEFA